MHQVITFTSSKFDVTKEDENPINPIYGQSLFSRLKEKVSGKVELEQPEAEDWGWYTNIDWYGRSYLFGASATEVNHPEYEWVFQIEKHRTLKKSYWVKINKPKTTNALFSLNQCCNQSRSLAVLPANKALTSLASIAQGNLGLDLAAKSVNWINAN